jgi:hypothetical protein
MRRSKNLGAFVPEIERFFYERRRNTCNNRNDISEERTLKEYATPSTDEPHAIIVYPTVEANNLEIKPALLNLINFSDYPLRIRIFILLLF